MNLQFSFHPQREKYLLAMQMIFFLFARIFIIAMIIFPVSALNRILHPTSCNSRNNFFHTYCIKFDDFPSLHYKIERETRKTAIEQKKRKTKKVEVKIASKKDPRKINKLARSNFLFGIRSQYRITIASGESNFSYHIP
jgi:hypothetical protein